MRRAGAAIGLVLLVTVFGVGLSGCVTDQSADLTASVKDRVGLTASQPVAVIEFEGLIAVSHIANDEMVAYFVRREPGDTDAFRRANVGEFRNEVWVDGAWQIDDIVPDGGILLTRGENKLRYRWTFVLAEDALEGTVPINAEFGPAFSGGPPYGPTEEEVPTVALRIVSVTHP